MSTMEATYYTCDAHNWTFEEDESCPECDAEVRVWEEVKVIVAGLQNHGWEHNQNCDGWHSALSAIEARVFLKTQVSPSIGEK